MLHISQLTYPFDILNLEKPVSFLTVNPPNRFYHYPHIPPLIFISYRNPSQDIFLLCLQNHFQLLSFIIIISQATMTDKLKSLKNLESSIIMLNKSSRNPMSSSYLIQQSMHSSGHNQIDTVKFLKKYGHLYNKSQTIIPKQRDEKANKQRNNDYVKKIMFDNQQLSKKIKQVSKANKILEQENRKLVMNYCEIRQNFVALKQKYANLIHEYGIQNEQIFDVKEKQEIENEKEDGKYKTKEAEPDVEFNIFARLFRGASTESEAIKQSIKELEAEREKDVDMNSSIQNFMFKKSVSREGELQIPDLNRRTTVFSFRKSESITTLSVSTQTDQQYCQPIYQQQQYLQNEQSKEDQNRYNTYEESKLISPSSRETELLMKISQYEAIMKELEKKNQEILGKYERIKSIIGGEMKVV